MDLYATGLPAKIVNPLRRAGYETVEQVAQVPDRILLRKHNIGTKTLEALRLVIPYLPSATIEPVDDAPGVYCCPNCGNKVLIVVDAQVRLFPILPPPPPSEEAE